MKQAFVVGLHRIFFYKSWEKKLICYVYLVDVWGLYLWFNYCIIKQFIHVNDCLIFLSSLPRQMKIWDW
jgi:hypothetical protein